jgi:serine protease Do
MVSVMIKSDPEGADIIIDGNFVGNTPSSVLVKSGEHTIVIEKPGYKKWDRFIRIDPRSNITLNATLDPN